MKREPRVGVAVIVMNGDKILMSQRRNIRGDGFWQFPGGHLEFMEEFDDAARREVREETGLGVRIIDKDFPFASVNEMFDRKKHYVIQFIRAKYISGTPENKEPHKSSDWSWHSWYDMSKPLFAGIKYLVKHGRDPIKEPWQR